MTGSGAKMPFDEVDPFNPNRVRGYVLRSRSRRGDLEITHVNGRACPQHVFATPHLADFAAQATAKPFERADAFEKIDGTNVLLYRYRDADGAGFTSYKTRLSPFLRRQPYGDFVALWREIVDRYRLGIAALTAAEPSFGFELFGSRIRILTDHPTPLDARLLYALDPTTGRVLDPAAIPAADIPMADRWARYGADTPVAAIAADLIARCERRPDVEGAVIYLVRDGFATAFKLKPAAVRERQARYRELYGLGKAAPPAPGDHAAVIARVDAHVERAWTPALRAQHRRVIEIVRDDLGKELAFDAPSVDAPSAPPVATRDPIPDDVEVLWTTIWGSQMWGMAGPGSDADTCTVHRRPPSDLPRPHERQRGWHRKTDAGDEHHYEVGRAVDRLLAGSLTLLYGVMSPLLVAAHSTAHAELRGLLEAAPSRVFLRALLRDVEDSERAMARAHEPGHYRKHLRIACRNLAFGITLFSTGRYEFRPSAADDPAEIAALRGALIASYHASSLPERFDRRPFDDYVARWRDAARSP